MQSSPLLLLCWFFPTRHIFIYIPDIANVFCSLFYSAFSVWHKQNICIDFSTVRTRTFLSLFNILSRICIWIRFRLYTLISIQYEWIPKYHFNVMSMHWWCRSYSLTVDMPNKHIAYDWSWKVVFPRERFHKHRKFVLKIHITLAPSSACSYIREWFSACHFISVVAFNEQILEWERWDRCDIKKILGVWSTKHWINEAFMLERFLASFETLRIVKEI